VRGPCDLYISDANFRMFKQDYEKEALIAECQKQYGYPMCLRTGKQWSSDHEPVLRATWLTVIEQLGAKNLIIGGKSMGGRIASLVADEAGVAGLICLGYPFHPAGKSDRLRVEHLRDLKTPTLIVQGERDPFTLLLSPGWPVPRRCAARNGEPVTDLLELARRCGTDREYQEWIQRQPSCLSGAFSEWVNGEAGAWPPTFGVQGSQGSLIKPNTHASR
jgi:hypothetical protein